MRPLRALGVVALVLAAWAVGRAEVVVRDFAAWRAGAPAPGPVAPAEMGLGGRPPPASDLAAEAAPEFAWADEPGPAAAPPPAQAMPIYVPQPIYLPAPGYAEPPRRRRRAANAEEADSEPRPRAITPGGVPEAPPVAARAERQGPRPPAPLSAQAFAAADRGYRALAAGERRAAADAFKVALTMAPDHPSAPLWRVERARLTKRVTGEFYAILRDPGRPGSLAASRPVLGGGASGASFAFTPKPLARRPLSFFARSYVPNRTLSQPDDAAGQAAVGVSWKPFARLPVTVSAEQLIALGPRARDDFSVRVGGGGERRLRGLHLTGYGEAGTVGFKGDFFAGGQMTLEKRLKLPLDFAVAPGIAAWTAVDSTDRTVARFDFSPTLRVQHPKLPVVLTVDYRLRAAGEAAPGDGVALSLYGQF